jgi:hypothetical protein
LTPLGSLQESGHLSLALFEQKLVLGQYLTPLSV